MIEFVSFLNEVSVGWWRIVFHATWQSSLVASILLVIVWLGRRWSSPLRYGILLVALLKFAMPPMFSLPTGLFGYIGPEIDSVSDTTAPIFSTSADSTLEGVAFETTTARPLPGIPVNVPPAPETPVVSTEAPSPEAIPAFTATLSARAWGMIFHFLGMLVVLAYIVVQISIIRKTIRKAQTVTEGPLHECLNDLCERLGVNRRPNLLIVADSTAPAAYGIIAPCILLPKATAESQGPAGVRMILAHELAHYRRHDLWVNWIQIALFAAWWFNPVYWLLSRAIRQVCEDCCDDLLLSNRIGSNEVYCETLLRAASDLTAKTPIGATLGFAEKLHPLGRRIKRIMEPGLKRRSRLSIVGSAVVVAMGLVVWPGLRAEVLESGKGWAETASIGELVERTKNNESWLWEMDSILIEAEITNTTTKESIQAQREIYDKLEKNSGMRVTIADDLISKKTIVEGWDDSRYVFKELGEKGRYEERIFKEEKYLNRSGGMSGIEESITRGNSTDHLADFAFSYFSFGRLTDADTWWGENKKRCVQFPIPPVESFLDEGVKEREGKSYRVIRALRPSHREYWIGTETKTLEFAMAYSTPNYSRSGIGENETFRKTCIEHILRLLLSQPDQQHMKVSVDEWLEGEGSKKTDKLFEPLKRIFPEEIPRDRAAQFLLDLYNEILDEFLTVLESEKGIHNPKDEIHHSMMGKLRDDPLLIEKSLPFNEFRNADWREVSPGRFFPFRQGCKMWVPGSRYPDLVASDMEVSVTRVALNQPLPEDLFPSTIEQAPDPVASQLAADLIRKRDEAKQAAESRTKIAKGRVVTRRGEGVEGARVLLYLDKKEVGLGNRLVEEVRTDLHGGFEFKGPIQFGEVIHHSYTDDVYRLFALHPDYALAWSAVRESEERDSYELVLTEPRVEKVYVHDSAGKPIAGADVWLAGGGDRESSDPLFRSYFSIEKNIGLSVAKTDSAGLAYVSNLPDVRCSYYAKLPGYAQHGGCAGTEMELSPGATVGGRVIDPAGNGVAGAKVKFMADWMHMGFMAETDARGNFKLEDLPAKGWDMSPWGAEADASGIYKVTLHSSEVVAEGSKVTLEQGQILSDMAIPAQTGVLVNCKVIDTSTKLPLSGARLWGENAMGRIDGYSGSDGVFSVRVLPGALKLFFQSPPDGVYIDSSQSHRTDRLDFTAEGEVMNVTMEAPPIGGVLASLRGRVKSPPEMAPMDVTVFASAGSFETSTKTGYVPPVGTNSEGSFELLEVPAGRELCLFAATKDRSFAGVGVYKIPSDPDQFSEVEVELKPTRKASKVIKDGEGNLIRNTSLVIRPVVGGNTMLSFDDHSAKTDNEGRLETDGIVPGLEYYVRDERWERAGAIDPNLFYATMRLIEEE